MATVAEIVDSTLRAAGIPIVGVSIGTEADRLTWSVQFDPSATSAQRTQAASILATVAVDATAQHTQDQTDVKQFVDNLPLVQQAVYLTILDQVNVIRARLPVPLAAITVAQWIAAVKSKVDSL
jgi:hypothetical protein